MDRNGGRNPPGSDGEAEVGVGGVEVSEVGSVVAVVEEEVADDLVGHQAAQDLHPHRRRPFPPRSGGEEAGGTFDLDPAGAPPPPLGDVSGQFAAAERRGGMD